MPYSNPGAGDSGSGQVSYPVDAMRQTATDILAAIKTARQQHTTHWNTIEHYLTLTCAPSYTYMGGTLGLPDVSGHLREVLEPHAKRLTASYDWLEIFANALLNAANSIEANEQSIINTFS